MEDTELKKLLTVAKAKYFSLKVSHPDIASGLEKISKKIKEDADNDIKSKAKAKITESKGDKTVLNYLLKEKSEEEKKAEKET
jgi:hypothetical protein